MTFGTEWGFGVDANPSREIFDRYIAAEGNFVDTADGYTNGQSEEMIGKFVSERKLRDRAVVATKFTFTAEPGNPNTGGDGRKNIHRALEGSLRRLQTDYVDLYYLRAWDRVTPVEEVVSRLSDLVQAGRSGTTHCPTCQPAWYVARAQTLAEKGGKERLIGLPLEYSLVKRTIERPLAGGFLSGKYRRKGSDWRGEGRFDQFRKSNSPMLRQPTKRHWKILEPTIDVSNKLGSTPAQIALNWVVTQPGMTSAIICATKVARLEDNLGAIEFTIPAELRKILDDASGIEPGAPYTFFGPMLQSRISGGTTLHPWTPAKVYPDVEVATPTAEAAKAKAVER